MKAKAISRKTKIMLCKFFFFPLLQRNFPAKAAKHVLLIEKAHHRTIKRDEQCTYCIQLLSVKFALRSIEFNDLLKPQQSSFTGTSVSIHTTGHQPFALHTPEKTRTKNSLFVIVSKNTMNTNMLKNSVDTQL